MTRSMRRTVPAMLVALGAGSTLALAAEPTAQQMQKQIEALQAEINQLKTTQEQQLSAADVDATLERVLSDAENRSQLLQVEGFTAGYSKGKFMLQSADGAFTLNPNFQIQLRHVINVLEEDGDDTDVDHGFEIRRAKFGVGGKLWKNFEYTLVWATNRAGTTRNVDVDDDGDNDLGINIGGGGDLVLEDAVFGYKFADSPFSVFGGQFKDPVNHEELVSSKRQLAADRSIVNETLGGGATDRVQGVGVRMDEGPLMATLVYHDGANSDNTNYAGGPDFGVAGRVEYLVFGDKKRYDDFTAMGTEEDMLVIGAGADWTQDGSGDAYTHTIDAQYETGTGLALYGAYNAILNETGEDDAYDWGALAQVGYMLNDKFEVFGRFGWVDLEDADDEIYEITGGVNYYLHGHSAKFTVDLTWLPNGSDSDSGLGYRGSSDDEDQFVLRSQFQLLI